MFNKEQNQYIALNYNIDTVFMALINGIQTLRGFSIVQADQVNHILYVDKAMSAWTWGESITITLNVNPADNQTYVYFSSDSNLGTEIAAKRQNRKNIESIMNAMNQFLMQQPQQQMYQVPQQQMYPQQMYPQQMPQQNMYNQPAQQMPVQQQYAGPEQMYQSQAQPVQQPQPVQQMPVQQAPVSSTQHQGDALSDNMNNM